jgi:hypothetical protein
VKFPDRPAEFAGAAIMATSRSDDPDAPIRQILLADWDPHNAAVNEAAHGTYNQYITPLRELIDSGVGEDALIGYLHEREKETMCFPSLGTERLRHIARKLMRLRSV